MRILVTGASGFIGSHLKERLKREGHEVFGLSRKEGQELRADIRETGKILNFIRKNRIELIYHLSAALGSHPGGEKYIMDVNYRATKELALALIGTGVKLVFFSSTGVHGNVPPGKPADENTPPSPISPYEKSKALAEEAVLEARDRGLEAWIIRPGWVYGPGDRRTFKLFRFLMKNTPLFGSGKNHQQPIYIDDLVEASLAFLNAPPSPIYIITGPEILTLREFVRVACEAFGCKKNRIFLPAFPLLLIAHPLQWLFSLAGKEAPLTPAKLSFFLINREFSIERAKREINFSPKVSFSQGTERAFRWYKEMGWI